MTFYLAGLLLLRAQEHAALHPDPATHLSGTDRAVLASLFCFAAEGKHEAFASASKVASRSGFSRRTVLRSFDNLVALGVVTAVRRDRRPTRYTLTSFFTTTGDTESPVKKGRTGATVTPPSDRQLPSWRQGVTRLVTERHHAGDRESPQGTEVSDGTKWRNERTDQVAASGSGPDSAGAPQALPSTGSQEEDQAPQWATAGGVPPGVVPTVVDGPFDMAGTTP